MKCNLPSKRQNTSAKYGKNADPRLVEIVENYDKYKIGLDDEFPFGCSMCGKCCINREDIMLTPRDIFRMAKELKMSMMDFVKEYCDCYIGPSSKVPVVRLISVGEDKHCPMLKDRKCIVHQSKPMVCALFPIGRSFKTEQGKPIAAENMDYLFMNPGCGNGTEKHTVRDWLESFNIPLEDEFHIKWTQGITEMSELLRKYIVTAKEKDLHLLYNALFLGMYGSYHTEHDFMPQFERNIRLAKELVEQIASGGGESGE